MSFHSFNANHQLAPIVSLQPDYAKLVSQKMARNAFIEHPDRYLVQSAGQAAHSLESALRANPHPSNRSMIQSLLSLGLLPHSRLPSLLSGFVFAGLYNDNTPILRSTPNGDFECIMIRCDGSYYASAYLSQNGLDSVSRLKTNNRNAAALEAVFRHASQMQYASSSQQTTYWREELRKATQPQLPSICRKTLVA